ncbi:phospholipase D family protein [Pulveribacter sp.]|uniref:phospholipase D family protein n=1 Tax=Pulveribacter sp. TaxID=2678893 RepID=UPI0028B1287F|nr:phospholipase D family protein [Pulveribacter sp.]
MPASPHLLRPRLAALFSRGWVMASLALVCSACAGLPKDVDRPVSTAFDAASEPTALSTWVAEQRRAAGARSASGFMLLSGPQEAYGSRLALVEHAQKTLDLQYYAIHADASTARLLEGVVQAARRGVRVRILLDDFHSTGRNALVMRLAFEPHIEMRMFNPVAGTRASTLGRLWGSLTDFSRVQQRMHNKLFIADNVMGVTGGRNLGDAYFGQGQAENFVDLDVLAVGPIVADMSHSFDSYWNNTRAYPVQSLITREELDRMREEFKRQDAQEAEKNDQPSEAGDAKPAPASPPSPAPVPAPAQAKAAAARAAASSVAADVAPPPESAEDPHKAILAWNQQPMDLQRVPLVWAPAVILADKPTKIPLDGEDTTAREPGVLPTKAAASAASLPVEAKEGAKDQPEPETVVDGLLTLMTRTQRELLIISPYFVPGDDMKAAFAAARARGVRVRILTNSLASNDAPIAHVGYARHRRELLEMGVELYELRSELAGLRSAFGDSGGSANPTGSQGGSDGGPGASRSMLHSKVIVMDRRLVVIGSMNLDLRSQLQNTEIALLVRSSTLAKQAARQIDLVMHRGAWHVEQEDKEGGGALVWRAPEGSGLEDAHTDPDSSFALRLILRLLGPLAPDRLL